MQIQADGLSLAFYFPRYPGKLLISLKGASSFLLTVVLYSLCGCTTIYLTVSYGHTLALFLIFFFFLVNSHTIKFNLSKHTVKWFLVCF